MAAEPTQAQSLTARLSTYTVLAMQPGSDMAKAEKLWAKRQRKLAARRARSRHLQKMRLRRQQRQAARRGERLPQVCHMHPALAAESPLPCMNHLGYKICPHKHCCSWSSDRWAQMFGCLAREAASHVNAIALILIFKGCHSDAQIRGSAQRVCTMREPEDGSCSRV